MGKCILYIGTYSGRASRGIYACSFSPESGSLVPLGLMAEAVNPSFIVLNAKKSALYSVSETGSYGKDSGGAIQAYEIDPRTGKLSLLNQMSSNGSGPCFLSFDKAMRCLFVANFRGGSVAVFPLSKRGSIMEPTARIVHCGTGANPARQSGPHPHSVELSPDGSLLIVADLGLDQLSAYGYDATKRSISSTALWNVKLHDGAGPRHFAFDRKGRYLYVLNEIESSISVFSIGYRDQSLQHVQTMSSLQPGYTGQNDAAEIRLSSDNRFLYVSNRGADNIQAFAVDATSGSLTALEAYSTGGKTPLTFQFSPNEKFIVIANQGSDLITLLRRDTESGHLSLTGISQPIPSPASLAFFTHPTGGPHLGIPKTGHGLSFRP